MSTRPNRFSLPSSQATALGEGAMEIPSDDPHAVAPSLFVRNGSWRATRHLLICARGRIRESRKGRPCSELGLSAYGLSTACLHLRAPDAPCPKMALRPDKLARMGLRASLRQLQRTRCSLARLAPPLQLASTSGGLGAKPPISRLVQTGDNLFRLLRTRLSREDELPQVGGRSTGKS